MDCWFSSKRVEKKEAKESRAESLTKDTFHHLALWFGHDILEERGQGGHQELD